jgi:hypothetical protein
MGIKLLDNLRVNEVLIDLNFRSNRQKNLAGKAFSVRRVSPRNKYNAERTKNPSVLDGNS